MWLDLVHSDSAHIPHFDSQMTQHLARNLRFWYRMKHSFTEHGEFLLTIAAHCHEDAGVGIVCVFPRFEKCLFFPRFQNYVFFPRFPNTLVLQNLGQTQEMPAPGYAHTHFAINVVATDV